MISGFLRKVNEICALLGYYTVFSGNSLPTLWSNLLVSSSRVTTFQDNLFSPSWSWDRLSQNLARNYCYWLHDIPADHRSQIAYWSADNPHTENLNTASQMQYLQCLGKNFKQLRTKIFRITYNGDFNLAGSNSLLVHNFK